MRPEQVSRDSHVNCDLNNTPNSESSSSSSQRKQRQQKWFLSGSLSRFLSPLKHHQSPPPGESSPPPHYPFPSPELSSCRITTPLFSKTHSPSSMWASLSLSANSSPVTESRTGMSFPSVLGESQQLLGVGLRRKAVLGLKNIDVYAFGVYADDCDVKEFLGEKDGSLEDLMESDVGMTVRLQIVYGRLSIRSVRNAFEESVGSRLKKFGGSDNQELLQRFTSQFRDEYKIPRGSIIDMTREKGYVLRTIIDGEEVGSIQSKLLCKSILDLYIGGEPFDSKAKEDAEWNLASLLGK